MASPKQISRIRPYWHVDLKWISGILFLFALGATLLLYNLSTITEKDRAITLSATIVAGLFSKDGLDDEKGVAEFRQKAAAAPGDTYSPVAQFPQLSITKQQAATLSPRELRIALFSGLTGPIYEKGVRGAAQEFTSVPADQEEFIKNASLLGVFTKTTHDSLQRAFIITAVLSLLFGVAVIYFSAGWGRAVSPGLILLAVSPLGAFAGLLLLHPPRDGDSPFASLPESAAHEIGNSLSHSYLVAAVVGIILLLAAFIGKMAHVITQRRKLGRVKT